MFITKKAPIQFKTGDIFSPEAINENILFVKKGIQERANEEVHRWTSTYSFNPDVSTILNSGTATSLLARSIPHKTTRTRKGGGCNIVIESITITAYYTATNPFILTVTGDTTKTIEIPVRDSSLATIPFDLVELANITHSSNTPLNNFLVLSASGGGALPAGVTITKFDVTVGFASNKYEAGNRTSATSASSAVKPNVNDESWDWDINDSTLLNAATFSGTSNSIKNRLETLSSQAGTGTPVRWGMVEFSDFTYPVTLYKPFPLWEKASFASEETSPNVVGVYIEGYANASTSVTYGLKDRNSSAVVGQFISSVSPGSFASGTFASSLTSIAYTGTPNDLTQDLYFYITLGATGALDRATVYILYQ